MWAVRVSYWSNTKSLFYIDLQKSLKPPTFILIHSFQLWQSENSLSISLFLMFQIPFDWVSSICISVYFILCIFFTSLLLQCFACHFSAAYFLLLLVIICTLRQKYTHGTYFLFQYFVWFFFNKWQRVNYFLVRSNSFGCCWLNFLETHLNEAKTWRVNINSKDLGKRSEKKKLVSRTKQRKHEVSKWNQFGYVCVFQKNNNNKKEMKKTETTKAKDEEEIATNQHTLNAVKNDDKPVSLFSSFCLCLQTHKFTIRTDTRKKMKCDFSALFSDVFIYWYYYYLKESEREWERERISICIFIYNTCTVQEFELFSRFKKYFRVSYDFTE